jgi:secreted trypsin-like serine protease
VVGGSAVADDEVPSVGAFVRTGGLGTYFVCAGTLVAPQVVLTAAHCTGSDDLSFAFGRDPLAAARRYAVAWSLRHPEYAVEADTGAVHHDIALVGLAEEVMGVAPSRVAQEPPGPGDDVELVGYGSTAVPDDSRRARNVGKGTVVATTDTEIQVGQLGAVQACTGDSGGPAFTLDVAGERQVAAVTSRAVDPAEPCLGGSVHTRVDSHADFLESGLGNQVLEHAARCDVARLTGSGRQGRLAGYCAILFVVCRGRVRFRRATGGV